jgi:hypothetical protein
MDSSLRYCGALSAFASLSLLLASQLAAQSTPILPSSAASAGSRNVSVVGGSGTLQPRDDRGIVEKVAISPGQNVPVVVTFGASATGKVPSVEPLDGGSVSVAAAGVPIAPDGRFAFAFAAGQQAGLYRVVARCGGAEYLLRFSVVQPEHPLPASSQILDARAP